MEATTVAPGTVLGGRYELREPLAAGGMGEVWRAEDRVLDRIVAVKVLLPSLSADPGFAERFQAEARTLASLSDPSVVEVYDYGQSGTVTYMVMRLVEGESLHALLNRVGPLPAREAMTIVAQAARALHHAHRSGVVHRDVKPSNLVVRPDGRLVLTDFGIAHGTAADPAATTGRLMGTVPYLAPEQITGDPVGPATDVYALGVVAYESLTMTMPFDDDRQEPRPLPGDLPSSIRHVVMRALAADPADRWPSAEAMAEAADRAARGLPASPWVGTAPVLRAAPRPAPTAALPPIADASGQRRRPWPGLIPVVAGAAILMVAIGIVLGNADSRGGLPISPPGGVQPSTSVSPQQTVTEGPDEQGEDRHDNSGPGGGGGGHGRG